jgi:8-oxo-dGTP pyrophosphatase MutT (NUDIX family)
VNEHGDVLLEVRPQNAWAFPEHIGAIGGIRNNNERPIVTALREFWEETGVRKSLSDLNLIQALPFNYEIPEGQVKVVIFVCLVQKLVSNRLKAVDEQDFVIAELGSLLETKFPGTSIIQPQSLQQVLDISSKALSVISRY